MRKFNYSDVKSASTPTDLEKPLVQDGDVANVDEHLYRSMKGSLMYLTASRPDIMFKVCACARFQVSPKSSHLLAIKRILPSLGLWYSKDSPLELVAYTDSDYAGAIHDRKSTTGGCQFLGNRQVLWIQNQLLDYGISNEVSNWLLNGSLFEGRNVVCSSSVGFHTTQQMVISSPCLIDNKELTSPEQTAPSKDFSNPLLVDSLLKTIWSSMHHVFTMKHWLVKFVNGW
ncbi:hypothetical protein Tco_0484731 [Tanacetum coccineum]